MKKSITFEIPEEQDWAWCHSDDEFFDRVKDGPEGERLQRDLRSAGAEVEDEEYIFVTFEEGNEEKVRAVIAAAKAGEYGPDCKAFWAAAVEKSCEYENEDEEPDWYSYRIPGDPE